MSLNGLFRNVEGISNSTQGVVDILGRQATGSFWAQLRPASYKKVKFGVLGGAARFGRRNAVHEYPFRDTVWVEDLGKSARRIQVSGFLVGDDVIAQRDQLIAKCEEPGDGELVHPTLGRLNVALIDFSCNEHQDRGRVFEVTFYFIEQGQRLYPQAASQTKDVVGTAATAADASSLAAFAKRAATALVDGAAAANQAAKQAAAWAATAIQAGNDATSLLKLGVSLPGEFGRLLGLASGVSVGEVVAVAAGMTLQGLLGQSAASRALLSESAGTLAAAGAAISASDAVSFGAAAQGLAAALLSASSTPGDALRSLSTLAAFTPVGVASGNALIAQAASADLFRRAAVVAMARAAAQYQPASSDDAAAVRALVLQAVDNEITTAGDQAEDEVFSSLRSLRSQVVADLNARGAALPTLVTVRTGQPMPSLALAQRLYRDPDRASELVRRAVPVHPAFMPTTFQALNQ